MTISLVLDVTIAVLLVFTISYAVRLNYRLSQLRGDKAELEKLAKTFADATVRAEKGAHKLLVTTDGLQKEIKKAEVLKDDLAYLVERGGSTADEMLERVRTTRKYAPALNKGNFSDEDLAGDMVGERANESVNDFTNSLANGFSSNFTDNVSGGLPSGGEIENPLRSAIANSVANSAANSAGNRRAKQLSGNSVKDTLRERTNANANTAAAHINPLLDSQADAERVLMKVLGTTR